MFSKKIMFYFLVFSFFLFVARSSEKSKMEDLCKKGDEIACNWVNATDFCDDDKMKGCADRGQAELDLVKRKLRLTGIVKEQAQEMKEAFSSAVPHFQEACEGGYFEACVFLGKLNNEGHSFHTIVVFEKNMKKAEEYLTKACNNENFSGCYALGQIFANEKNIKKAKKYYITACEGGYTSSCNKLGKMFADAKDFEKAQKFYKLSCDKGDENIGCRSQKAVEKTIARKISKRSRRVMDWYAAKKYCKNLKERGHFDWKLPTISKLRTFIHNCPATETGGACKLTDDCVQLSCFNDACSGCPKGGKYSKIGDRYSLWSQTQLEPENENSDVEGFLIVNFSNGAVENASMYTKLYVRCVR